jgi:type IV pilus assembly protein PilQ
MGVNFNHTIVHSNDKKSSASFLIEILGLSAPVEFGPFLVVELDNGASLDFVDAEGMKFDTQRANTRVQVSNGETTVIGGIYVSREQTSQDRTPGLHRIPLLGWLFKRDSISDENRELLIFITPKIQRM